MLRSCLAVAVALLALPPLATADDVTPPPGFTAVFNGNDLSGWHAVAPHSKYGPEALAALPEDDRKAKLDEWWTEATQHWSVDNGELVNDGHGPYLTSDREYGDIELLLEYKTVALADSGIYLRGTPQVQIWDTTKEGGKWDRNADKGSGGLFNNTKGAPGQLPLAHADRAFGEWNQFRIIQVGARTTVFLNGKKVVDNAIMENFWDRSRPLYPKGVIQLQTHGGEIRWRNIFVREIGSEEATAMLRGVGDGGCTPIFNGQNLDGWAGPVENYQVKDGTLMCLPGKGGTIYTKEEYSDFVARLEFKLPEGGNNGLAIRYPGEGDTAYVGMCELQILDTEHPKYKNLDPRQAHGSAYGMAAAHRGYLRPTGEWNYQEVTVQGSKIKVELNGYVILDTDLSQITEYMANSPHPGKERTSGHFGFAGHSDPVQFRNVSIKPLDAETAFAPGDAPELLSEQGAGEGPAWHPELGVLTSGGGHIYRRDRDGQQTVFRENAGSNGLLFDREGRLVICEPVQRRVTRVETDGTLTVLTDNFEGKRYNQPNDLAIDSRNRIYFSDPRYGDRSGMELRDADGKEIEGVYRIDLDGSVTRVIGHEVDRPNGLVVTPDDRFLFVADNNNNTAGGARKLWRFLLKPDGSVDLPSQTLIYDWQTTRGPDGMKLDRAGNLYVAAGINEPNPPYEDAEKPTAGIYVFNPDGQLIDFAAIPRDETTNCAFGGDDLRTLFVTAGGSLWTIRTKTAGNPVWPALP